MVYGHHNRISKKKDSHILKADIETSSMCHVGWILFYFCNKRQCCNLFTWDHENKTAFVKVSYFRKSNLFKIQPLFLLLAESVLSLRRVSVRVCMFFPRAAKVVDETRVDFPEPTPSTKNNPVRDEVRHVAWRIKMMHHIS